MPEANDPIRLSIDGQTYSIDPDDLELGEIEIIEDEMDCAIDSVDFGRAKAMRLLAYTVIHRENKNFSMDDAKRLKIGAFSDPDAESENGTGAAKRPTRAAKSA